MHVPSAENYFVGRKASCGSREGWERRGGAKGSNNRRESDDLFERRLRDKTTARNWPTNQLTK